MNMRRAGALQAGLTESMVEKVANPRADDFAPEQYAALRLVGLLLANPRGVDDELRAEVERHFTPAEIAELVLATMMNRVNAMVKVVAGLEVEMPVTVFTAHGF
jgi:alkylhydroperoxidase family enzyme